jgi:hypothetical protein
MLQVFQLFWTYIEVFHLDVAKVDLVLQMLQWDSPAIVHACGKWRGCRQGHGWSLPMRAAERGLSPLLWLQVEPNNFYRLSGSYG